MKKPSLLSTPLGRLRLIALIEGISFLLLLFIAMPLKHLADMPMAVTYAGWLHGFLFIGVCLALAEVMFALRWPITRGAMVFIAALIPFGPFIIDRRLRDDQKA